MTQRGCLKCCFRFGLLCVLLGWSVANVFGQLRADFSTDQLGGCAPLAIKFTNKTSGATAGAVYSWDFGNGNISSAFDGGAMYTLPQIYTITLTVKDGGVSSSKTGEIEVYKNPVFDYTASVAKGCFPLPVSFTTVTDPGSGTASAYVWDFGDGSVISGSGAIVSHTYLAAQNPELSVTVTDNHGCHTTLQKNGLVNILPGIDINITADKNFLCLVTDPVQFQSTVTGPGTLSYSWDFGNGAGSSSINPSYVFNKKGVYGVSLKVTSSDGCAATKKYADSLNVASFNSDFTIPRPICMGSSYNFLNTSSPSPDKTTWYFDGVFTSNDVNPAFYANTQGLHSVKLENQFGACTQDIVKEVFVNNQPSPADFTYTELGKCGPPEAIQFTDISDASKHEWDFNSNIYADKNITSTDKSPVFNYTNSDTYHLVWLRSTSDSGCSVETEHYIFIYPPLAGIFADGPQNTCGTPNTEHFYTNRTDLTSYLWKFGDGTTSTEASPTHTYTDPGQYYARLFYTTADGCVDSSGNGLVFHVSPPLVIDFTASATTVCGNSPVTFTPIVNDPGVLYDLFDFGDGVSDFYYGHIYNTPGKYSVTLHVTTAGCSAFLTKTDFINVVPIFLTMTGQSYTCDGDRGLVNFNGNSSGADSLLWDFGDGQTETVAGDITGSYTHNYQINGSFFGSVTAKDNASGCTLSSGFAVYILHKINPVLTADKTVVCTSDLLNIKLNYNYESNYYAGSNPSTRFEYDDGGQFTGNINEPNPYWVNELDATLGPFEKGKKNLRAIVSTFTGCADTSNFIPLDIRGVQAGLQIVQDHLCFQSPVVLKDVSVLDPGNSIVSRSWDFGDGIVLDAGDQVTHSYLHPGLYPVKLTVKDAGGCSASSTDYTSSNVFVNGPEAIFTSSGNNVPLNSTVNFYNNSNLFGSTGTLYSWKFSDDGSTSTNFNASHVYPVAGDYTVTLTCTDPVTGCSSSTTQKIHVSNFNSAFSYTKSNVTGGCPPVLVNFTNNSVNFIRVTWDFGDGFAADNINNASHVYKDPGKYIVQLTVFGPNGLTDTILDSVIISAPSAVLQANPFELCLGKNLTDTAISGNGPTYTWDFGDGTLVQTSVPTASHVYTSPGLYNQFLIETDKNGCNTGTKLTEPVNVHPNPDVAVSPVNPWVCAGSSVSLEASGGFTYQWQPATGLNNGAIGNPVATPLLNTTYQVEAADELGCKNSTSVSISVIQRGLLKTGGDTAVCEGAAVQLQASGKLDYLWTGDTEGLDQTGISNPVARPKNTTVYTVTASDAHNCFPETADITVQVLPLPFVYAGPDTTVQAGASFYLHGSGGNDVVQWNWTPDKYLDCSNCASPLCKIRESTVFTLTGKSDDGCLSSSNVVIKMECSEDRVAIPNAFTPNGDGRNDLFVVHGISLIKHMVIYDRWGEKVFERNNFSPADPSNCWDGNQGGMPAVTGTYVYFIEMECPGGGAFTRKGSVILIR